MRNLDTNNRWMLCKDDFVARHFAMHRLLQRIAREEEDGSGLGEVDDVAEEDPFYHAPGMIVLGSANCMLASLCYNIEFDDDVNIYDYKGRSEGKLKVCQHCAQQCTLLCLANSFRVQMCVRKRM